MTATAAIQDLCARTLRARSCRFATGCLRHLSTRCGRPLKKQEKKKANHHSDGILASVPRVAGASSSFSVFPRSSVHEDHDSRDRVQKSRRRIRYGFTARGPLASSLGWNEVTHTVCPGMASALRHGLMAYVLGTASYEVAAEKRKAAHAPMGRLNIPRTSR